MFDPMTVGLGLVAFLLFKNKGETNFGALTPEREEVFRNAMEHLLDTRKMLALADAFQRDGLKVQAYLLRKRAEWRSRPDALRKEHETIFHRAMASTNLSAIAQIADVFEAQTATGMATALRQRIQYLQDQALAKAREDATKAVEEQQKTPEAKKESNGAAPHVEVVPKNQGPQDKAVA